MRGASLELPEGLVRDGEVVDRDGARRDAQELRRRGRTAASSVRLGVANQQIVVRVVELPRIEDEKQRDAAVRFQAAEAIAMPLDEAVLDHQVAGYTEAPDGTPRMQVVLVAARRKMIETLLEAVKSAGLKPEGIDLDAFALVRTLAAEGDEPDDDRARLLPPRRRDATSPSPSARPASSPGRCRRSGTRTTPARGSPTRSGCRSTTT